MSIKLSLWKQSSQTFHVESWIRGSCGWSRWRQPLICMIQLSTVFQKREKVMMMLTTVMFPWKCFCLLINRTLFEKWCSRKGWRKKLNLKTVFEKLTNMKGDKDTLESKKPPCNNRAWNNYIGLQCECSSLTIGSEIVQSLWFPYSALYSESLDVSSHWCPMYP